jgi:hypothetical protein
MPPMSWPIDPFKEVQAFEARHNSPESGALLAWAVWCVDSLFYLDDIDRLYDATLSSPHGHQLHVVDVAHGRWATSTCITSLDLCAAALARLYSNTRSAYEESLSRFGPYNANSSPARMTNLRAQIGQAALAWMDTVFADSRYATLRSARNSLIHSRTGRHFGHGRLKLGDVSSSVGIRDLVILSRDLASEHVASLIVQLKSL